jgi:uracil-DNA glycosylase family 4
MTDGPPDPRAAAARVARLVRQRLLDARSYGLDVTVTWRRRSAEKTVRPAPAASPAPPVAVRPEACSLKPEASPEACSLKPEASGALDAIRAEVEACRACVLCERRTRTVFGVGDPRAALAFVGEGPGEEEDRKGEPFVGPAGQLLDRMIAAMGLERKKVYIANVVKCRPPGNRTPEPREIICCLPFLRRQLEAIAPRVICTLGNVATRAILQTGESIGRLRGRFTEWSGVPVLPTFHPSYLLRNPEDKKLAWSDLRKIMAMLQLPGGEAPPKPAAPGVDQA